jgi:hypothetical protein
VIQGKIVSITVLLAYLLLTITTLIYAHCFLALNIANWIALISLLIFGGIFLLEGLGQILKILHEPRLKIKIKNHGIDVHNVGSEHEAKYLYFVVRNEGREEARGCRITVRVKGFWDNFEVLNPNFPSKSERFDVDPADERLIHLCNVSKKHGTTTVINIENFGKNSALTKGIYQLELRVSGKNLIDKKVHQLTLDLSLWENIGIKLDN